MNLPAIFAILFACAGVVLLGYLFVTLSDRIRKLTLRVRSLEINQRATRRFD